MSMSEQVFPGPALPFPQSVLLPGFVAAVAAGLSLRASPLSWPERLLLCAAGLLLWTLIEYLLHRWPLHHLRPFRRWHEIHHQAPERPIRVPLLFSLLLVATLIVLPLAGAALAVGTADAFVAAAPVVLGLLLGNVLQEAVHDRLHRAPARAGSWLERRRLAHEHHHLRDDRVAFGTLSGFWDRVFGTAMQR